MLRTLVVLYLLLLVLRASNEDEEADGWEGFPWPAKDGY